MKFVVEIEDALGGTVTARTVATEKSGLSDDPERSAAHSLHTLVAMFLKVIFHDTASPETNEIMRIIGARYRTIKSEPRTNLH